MEHERRMNRVLTDGDIDAICLRLTEFSGLTPEEHAAHHGALALFIDNQRRKAERWDKIEQQVGGWAIISALTVIGYAAWSGFMWFIKTH